MLALTHHTKEYSPPWALPHIGNAHIILHWRRAGMGEAIMNLTNIFVPVKNLQLNWKCFSILISVHIMQTKRVVRRTTSENRLGKLGLFSMEKRRLMSSMCINVHLKGESSFHRYPMTGKSQWLQFEIQEITFKFKKKSFYCKVVKHCYRLLREAAKSSFLETHQTLTGKPL